MMIYKVNLSFFGLKKTEWLEMSEKEAEKLFSVLTKIPFLRVNEWKITGGSK